MLDFRGKDQKAQQVCSHYARQFNNEELISILECKAATGSKNETLALARFFWRMLETAAEDRDNQIEVLREKITALDEAQHGSLVDIYRPQRRGKTLRM